jgi:hypothetical protein
MSSSPYSFCSFLAFVLLGSSVVSCGSGTSSTGGDGGVGSSGTSGGPAVLPDGTALPTVSCGDENVTSASGTWDVVSTGGKSGQGTAVITIDSSSFIVKSMNRTLAFTVSGATMTLQWTDLGREQHTPIAVTHTGDAVDTGLLPLAVGGQWTFKGQGTESCSSSLTANGFNATCSGLRSTPFGRLDGSVVGIRQQQLASIFGALGGTWHLAGSDSGSVDVTLSGNTFSAIVNSQSGPVGGSAWTTIKVCNGTAAGKSSTGLELAATRH